MGTRIVLIVLFLLFATASFGGEDYGFERKKADEGKKYGYINTNDSAMSSWFRRANRVRFGMLGIGGGSKNKLLQQGFTDEWVIAPQYDDAAKEFGERLAAVEINGRVGYIDSLNRMVIEPRFDQMSNLDGFSHGLAAVKLNGKYGFINKRGVFVIKPEFDYAENFKKNHLASVKMDGKYGAIDLSGELVVPCKYIAEEAMTTVPISNKLYRQAKEQAEKDYQNGKYSKNLSLIDEANKEVDKLLDNPYYIPKPNRAGKIKDEYGAKGFYYQDGTCVIAPIYDDLVEAGNNVILLFKNEKWGVADTYGRIIFEPQFDVIEYERDDQLLIVEKDDRVGLYSQTGRMILPICLDGIDKFIDGKALAYINYECGLVDTKGEFSNGLIEKAFTKVAKIDENVNGATGLVPFYQQILLAQPDFAMAHNNIGIINIESKDYNEGMCRLKVANKLEPDSKEIADNLKQAKKDRKDRRWHRVMTTFEVAAAVVTVAATTYAAVEGSSGSSGGGGSYASSGSGGGGGDCSQIMSQLNRYQSLVNKTNDSVELKQARATGKNLAHQIAPEYADGSTAGDNRLISHEKAHLRTYQKRVDDLKRQARKKGCM